MDQFEAGSPHQSFLQKEGGYTIRLITGNGNRQLAEAIAKHLEVDLEPCKVERFADGEIDIQLQNNIRGADVFLLQPTGPPEINSHIMELLLLIHTLKLSSAKRITVIMPYYGYARQDRKTRPRVPISASCVAHLIESVGPSRLVTVDLHCGQIQGFFHDTPVDNLYAELELVKYFRSKNFPSSQVVIVSPDAGGVERSRRVADELGVPGVATIIKRRVKAGEVDSMQIVGEVDGKICIITDDMIDTGGTLVKAVGLLKLNGARKVFACATHGVFSASAPERLSECDGLEEVIVTDSLPQEENLSRCGKLVVLTLAPLLAETIWRLHHEKSLSYLFTKDRLQTFTGSKIPF